MTLGVCVFPYAQERQRCTGVDVAVAVMVVVVLTPNSPALNYGGAMSLWT